MNSFEFEWDEHNIRHVMKDHPERGNTIEEVESLFYDKYFEPTPDRLSKRGEQEYSGVAIGNEGIEKHVVYVVRNGKIRPFSCRRAEHKERDEYREIVKQRNRQQ